jgi:hypothetical protein
MNNDNTKLSISLLTSLVTMQEPQDAVEVEFGIKQQEFTGDLGQAIKVLKAKKNQEILLEAAAEVIKIKELSRKTQVSLVQCIREARLAESRAKSKLALIDKAEKYASSTNNFIPLLTELVPNARLYVDPDLTSMNEVKSSTGSVKTNKLQK